jgi:clan AA aspartic protease
MITGQVTADQEATIPLIVRGPHDEELDIEAIIDTGFTGFLTLSDASIASLNLAFREMSDFVLADGSVVSVEVYRGSVAWDGSDHGILVLAADGNPLVGMSMLHGSHVTLDVVDGGQVTISPCRDRG